METKTFEWRGNTIKVFNPVPYGEHFQAWLNGNTNTIVLKKTNSIPEVGKKYYSNWIGSYIVNSLKLLINANGYLLFVGEVSSDIGTKSIQLWSCDVV